MISKEVMSEVLGVNVRNGFYEDSGDINLVDNGIWINDDLETRCKGTSIFLPLHNINQINEYEIETK